MLKYITGIILSLLLVGCATNPVVIKPEKQAVVVSDELFKEQDIPAPPNRDTYIESNTRDREIMLAGYIKQLQGVIEKYQIQIKSIYDTMKYNEKAINERKTQ